LCREFRLEAIEYTYGFDAAIHARRSDLTKFPANFPILRWVVGALTDALRRLIGDGELRRRLGRAALEDHTRDYEIHGHVARLVDLWREVARKS
jgi:hypothetical protein